MADHDRETGLDFRPHFNRDGLIGCIVQDDDNNQVLMFAWMNEEALRCTLSTNRATYYSRSRKRLWIKGETSGHYQIPISLRVDCDQDVLLLRVKQTAAACHMNYRTCFYRTLKSGTNLLERNQEPLPPPQ